MQVKKIVFLLFLSLIIIGCQQNPASQDESAKTPTTVKEFSTTITNYKYNPSVITVNKGDKVRIKVTNNDKLAHGFSLVEFGINDLIKPGQTKVIEFTASSTGQPVAVCSPQHGEELTVKVI